MQGYDEIFKPVPQLLKEVSMIPKSFEESFIDKCSKKMSKYYELNTPPQVDDPKVQADYNFHYAGLRIGYADAYADFMLSLKETIREEAENYDRGQVSDN